jgi:hypothetical protein
MEKIKPSWKRKVLFIVLVLVLLTFFIALIFVTLGIAQAQRTIKLAHVIGNKEITDGTHLILY